MKGSDGAEKEVDGEKLCLSEDTTDHCDLEWKTSGFQVFRYSWVHGEMVTYHL